MLRRNKEVIALFQLIDDPDTEVFDSVSEKIVLYGKAIIPDLENLWEHTADELTQERIEMLIHRVHFQDLQNELLDWCSSKNPNLLRGAIIIAQYQFPELDNASILTQFEQIRKSIWLELNNYLTPLEQAHVINNIFFHYFKFQGHELTAREPKHFCFNFLLDTKQGNSFTLGILYLAICEQLDIPVFAVNVPRQFILAYIDTLYQFYGTNNEGVQQIQFFIDPLNGMAYTQKDVDTYLKKINATDKEAYYTPSDSKEIILQLLQELALCFKYTNNETKADEINLLIQIIKNNCK